MKPVLFIEEVNAQDKPIDENSVLSDEQLQEGGLVKIEAFVRTKSSAAAVRKARQREREKAEGIKTLTVTAPEEAHAFFKTVAKKLTEGNKVEEAIKESVTSHAFVTEKEKMEIGKNEESVKENVTSHAFVTLDNDEKKKIEIGNKVLSLTGWRKLLAEIIGLI